MVTKTFAEVQEHNTTKSCWLVIHNKVYDVTKFLDEHPGGGEYLSDIAGRNASSDFEDNGHSMDARQILDDLYIADLDEKDHFPGINQKPTNQAFTPDKPYSFSSFSSSGYSPATIAVSILGIAVAFGCMLKIQTQFYCSDFS